MQTKILTKPKALPARQRAFILLVVLVVVFVGVTYEVSGPKPSVAAYCKVYKQETTQLGNNGGDTYLYSSSVFPNYSSNNAAKFIPVFSELDSVAPSDIEPQVKAMKDIFIKMNDDPTQTVSLALNGLPAESAVTQWTQQHCHVALSQ